MFAVGLLDGGSNLFKPPAVVHHLHHVTSNAYADRSAEAHRIELRRVRRRVVLDVAGRIASVSVVDAAAVTWDVLQHLAIEDGEPIGVADFGRSIAYALRRSAVIDLKYSLVIEATNDPTFFGFYSPDLEGFTGIGHSIEDCVYQARRGMEEHLELLKKQSLPVPNQNPNPKIVIQNQEPLAEAS